MRLHNWTISMVIHSLLFALATIAGTGIHLLCVQQSKTTITIKKSTERQRHKATEKLSYCSYKLVLPELDNEIIYEDVKIVDINTEQGHKEMNGIPLNNIYTYIGIGLRQPNQHTGNSARQHHNTRMPGSWTDLLNNNTTIGCPLAWFERNEEFYSKIPQPERLYLPPPPPRKDCFMRGTLVVTTNGLKPIEDIQVGDTVLSMGQPCTVTMTTRQMSSDIIKISIGRSGSFFTTRCHEFHSAIRNQFVCVEDLKAGEVLTSQVGCMPYVSSLVKIQGTYPVYNLVLETGSYHVGIEQILVRGHKKVPVPGWMLGPGH